MKLVYGGRNTGKTAKLIKDAAAVNGVIWVGTTDRKRHIEQLARDLGIECPPVYTVMDILDGKARVVSPSRRIAHVDDIKYFLWCIGGGDFEIEEINCVPDKVYRAENRFMKVSKEGDFDEKDTSN
jgi:hypothetical protein